MDPEELSEKPSANSTTRKIEKSQEFLRSRNESRFFEVLKINVKFFEKNKIEGRGIFLLML